MKIWVIIAIILVILGASIVLLAASSADWNFANLGTNKYETNTHSITQTFSAISIQTNTADIVFLPSEDGVCKVSCYENTKLKHSLTVADGVLTVNMIDERKWYDHIGIGFNSPKITVYLPQSEYTSLTIKNATGDIDIGSTFSFEHINIDLSTGDVYCAASAQKDIIITASTGDISLANLSAGSLSLEVSTGDIAISNATIAGGVSIDVSTGDVDLRNVKCSSLTANGTTGDIKLAHVLASEKIFIERVSGKIAFSASDAPEITLLTTSGDVSGSLLSEKIFTVKTSSGDIDIPPSMPGGRCNITTTSGDVTIQIEK
ncbi:MAG: DUF4097 family beta strand repeat protein [Clostridia bacterium]|nr:DUF4097 family beta strand repeat protein [Clostridia bacterium]